MDKQQSPSMRGAFAAALMGSMSHVMRGIANLSAMPSVRPNKRRSSKRQRINYRPDQRDFTKIRPEVQAAWDSMPEIQRETRQLERQSGRVAHKNYIKGVKALAMKEGHKGGSAALVFAR